MNYNFKVTPELGWFLLITFLTPIFSALAVLDESTLTDWKPWVIGIFAASIRAVFAAILSATSSPNR